MCGCWMSGVQCEVAASDRNCSVHFGLPQSSTRPVFLQCPTHSRAARAVSSPSHSFDHCSLTTQARPLFPVLANIANTHCEKTSRFGPRRHHEPCEAMTRKSHEF